MMQERNHLSSTRRVMKRQIDYLTIYTGGYMGIVDPGFKEARELTTIKLGCGEANRVFTMTKLQVCIQKVRIFT